MSPERRPPSNEKLLGANERVRAAMTELALAQQAQDSLLAETELKGNLVATAIAVDAIMTKEWGGDPQFTQRLVGNMTELLTPGQPFVIADRQNPNRFTISSVPADPFLEPRSQTDQRDKLVQAEVAYRGKTDSFQIADTRPGRNPLRAMDRNPPHYFDEPAKLRKFFGSVSLEVAKDPMSSAAAQTNEEVLLTDQARIAELFRQPFLLTEEQAPVEGIFLTILHNIRVVEHLDSDGLRSKELISGLSSDQRAVFVKELVQYLITVEREERENVQYSLHESYMYQQGGMLPGISGYDPLIRLFPDYEIADQVFAKVGKYHSLHTRLRRSGRR